MQLVQSFIQNFYLGGGEGVGDAYMDVCKRYMHTSVQSCLRLNEAMWTAKSSSCGFSVSFFWLILQVTFYKSKNFASMHCFLHYLLTCVHCALAELDF